MPPYAHAPRELLAPFCAAGGAAAIVAQLTYALPMLGEAPLWTWTPDERACVGLVAVAYLAFDDERFAADVEPLGARQMALALRRDLVSQGAVQLALQVTREAWARVRPGRLLRRQPPSRYQQCKRACTESCVHPMLFRICCATSPLSRLNLDSSPKFSGCYATPLEPWYYSGSLVRCSATQISQLKRILGARYSLRIEIVLWVV